MTLKTSTRTGRTLAVVVALLLLLAGVAALAVQLLRPAEPVVTARPSATTTGLADAPDEIRTDIDLEDSHVDDWPDVRAEPDGAPGADGGPEHPAAEPDPDVSGDATGTASAFAAAFARPPDSVHEAQWWAKVRPFLTAQAADDYLGTDPGLVAYTQVRGPASLREVQEEGMVAVVDVPTDRGVWAVTVIGDERRPDGWAVMSIVPEVEDGAVP